MISQNQQKGQMIKPGLTLTIEDHTLLLEKMEYNILDLSRNINQLAKRIVKMESEESITHPDNLSTDRIVRTEIREKKSEIYEQTS